LLAQATLRQRALLARLIGTEIDAADTIAARLLSELGSIGGVLSANAAVLSRFVDDAAVVNRIAIAKSAVLEGIGEQVRRTPWELTNIPLQQWVVGLFKGSRIERVHMVLLDHDKRLIFDEPLAEGDLQGVTGNLRKVVSCGIDAGASAVVLMHNHPSGNTHPSKSDIAETRRISFLLENLDLRLEDHLIVSGNAIFSMRGAMLI
jgi:DNA repair protein RadC